MQNNFSLDVRNGNQAVVIGVTGELDLASSPALEQELEQGAASRAELVIVDLRGLEFMDSTGLSVLVRAHQRAIGKGQRFGVVKGPQQVQRLLSLKIRRTPALAGDRPSRDGALPRHPRGGRRVRR